MIWGRIRLFWLRGCIRLSLVMGLRRGWLSRGCVRCRCRKQMTLWGLGCWLLSYQEDRLREHTVTMTIWLLAYWPLLSTGAIRLNIDQVQRLSMSACLRLPYLAAFIQYTQPKKNQFQWVY